MTDLQNFLAILTNGDEKFKFHWQDDPELLESKWVDFVINNDGGSEPIHLRAVFTKNGDFEYFVGSCEYDGADNV